MKKIFAVFMLLAMGLAFAHSGQSEDAKANVIAMQQEKLECRTAFYKNILHEAAERGAEAGTSVDADNVSAHMDADADALRAAAEHGDRKAFNDAAQSLREDAKEAARHYIEVHRELNRKAEREGESDNETTHSRARHAEATQELRAHFVEERQKMAECLKETSHRLAVAHAAYLEEWKAQIADITEHLKEKGVDTAEMEEVVQETQDTINGAGSDTPDSAVVEKTEHLRLRHHLLWAKFQVARIDAIAHRLEAHATANGIEADFSGLYATLTEARETIQNVQQGDTGQLDALRGLVQEAIGELRTLFHEVKG